MYNKSMKNLIIVVLAVVVIGLGVLLYGGYQEPPIRIGSIETGQEYNATTTVETGLKADALIKYGWGSIGSVVVTEAGDLEYRLVNATSVAALSAGYIDVDNETLVYVEPELAAGTYTFDVTFTDGLVFDLIAGTNGTTTITYR